MKSENNVTENTAEAKETQRNTVVTTEDQTITKDRQTEKTIIVTISSREITDTTTKTATETTTEMTRQTEASGTADLISEAASPKHRQKLLSRHLPKSPRTEIQASEDARVLPNSRSFR